MRSREKESDSLNLSRFTQRSSLISAVPDFHLLAHVFWAANLDTQSGKYSEYQRSTVENLLHIYTGKKVEEWSWQHCWQQWKTANKYPSLKDKINNFTLHVKWMNEIHMYKYKSQNLDVRLKKECQNIFWCYSKI